MEFTLHSLNIDFFKKNSLLIIYDEKSSVVTLSIYIVYQ